MPAKKRAAVEDADDSSPPGSPVLTNKRAKTGPNGREAKGKGKAKARVDEDENMDENEEDDSEVDVQQETKEQRAEKDKKFEEAHYDKIMASVKSRDKSGTISDYGIIEKVELFQFMCHQRLTFSFGPQINFIIGHNGSGKSAVLSAITIALGGKTISTGRGNGLKSFIREGQNAAEVTIQLKNKGDEAYRHKDFGDSIIITRRFTIEGGSTWKIKAKDGKVISTKKDELSKICDHMNIQVDNPMTVLTQDASRVFLASSNPTERYNFFLKGTQLQQLSDEYSVTLENIRQTQKILEQKKEAIPDLRAAFQEAKRRFDEADQARKQKAKQDDLKREKAWALVKDKEIEFERKLAEVAQLEHKLPRLEAEIAAAKAKLDELTAEFSRQEGEVNNLGNINDLERRKHELAGFIKSSKARLSAITNETKTMNNSIASYRSTVSEYDRQIEQESRKLARNTQERRDQQQNQLAAMQARMAEHERNLEAMKTQRQELELKKTDADVQGQELVSKKNESMRQIQFREELIRNCQKAEKDSLLPYGRNIQAVLAQIDRLRWYGNKPLGPLGAYVKAKDPQTWGELLRSQLAQQLCSFAITDPRDRNQLKKLLMDSKNPHVLITISSSELFDFSEGEPPSDYLTVLRALEITNPLVTRILVNTAGIESRVLAKTRLEAQRSLERLPRGGQAFTLDAFLVRVFPDGVSSTPLDIRKSGDSSNLMLTGRDSAGEIRRAQGEIDSLRQQISELKLSWDKGKNESDSYTRQLGALSEAEQRERNQLRGVQSENQKLQRELNEEMPANINALQDAKKAQVNEIRKKINDFSEVRNNAKASQLRLLETSHHHQSQLESLGTRRMEAQSHSSHWEKKLKETGEKLQKEKETAQTIEEEFVTWTKQAAQYCDRVENPRPLQQVEQLLESVGRALKEQQKKQGASLEELEERLLRAKQQYDETRTDIRAVTTLNKRLEKSLIKRYARWEGFRRHIALRTKVVFQYHLSQRGYFGKLLFDHEKRQLVLKVQTDDQASQADQKEKDPRSLSGGEKSFSTICLLLALWESIGCPIRCLDEFDVFMDAVNRRISMKMMIDTANASNQKQYILITPLDMSNVSWGTSVRVHRMSDPQRNQGTLGFTQ
ncbi:Structural maintenance of chromosomes protein 6 [Leucoagaricus sp. SymC.cos]|nr:Structural maintenance of chromosomes protein 6 [Leucoagaricus sp. SymC.cos]